VADGVKEREARTIDYQRVLSPLVDRARAFLRRKPYLMDPRDVERHWPPPMPTPEEWAEALYLLQTVTGTLQSVEGQLDRWREEGGPRRG
jgi:hypothetical protein